MQLNRRRATTTDTVLEFDQNLIRDVKRLADLVAKPSALENKELHFKFAVQCRPFNLPSVSWENDVDLFGG
jgi:hypothetical protein